MLKLNLLFYGLGGAGTRHYEIIDKFYKKKLKLFYFSKKKNKKEFINLKQEMNLNQSLNNKNFIIISSPTYNHIDIAIKAAKSNINIFCEKPFYGSLKKFNFFFKLIKKKKLKFLVGYQRRYHVLCQKFEKLFKNEKIIKINIVVNSYVPDWRKKFKFQDLYACKKNLGGGSILTECHELDYILKNFGIPIFLKCLKHSTKNLNLDCETSHKSILYYRDFKVFFKINMFNKNLQRKITIFSEKKTLELDLQNNHIIIKKKFSLKKIKCDINENYFQFIKQLKYFFYSKNFTDYELDLSYKNLIVIKAMKKSSNLKGLKVRL
jgi:predicted dehydrogenase